MQVYGDSELIVNQIKNLNAAKNDLLKKYKDHVWDLMEDFDAFNIVSIPRNKNKHVDRLAAIGAQFDIPNEIHKVEARQYVKIVVRPSMPDNNVTWQVFDSDEKIVNFLIAEAEFTNGNQQKWQ